MAKRLDSICVHINPSLMGNGRDLLNGLNGTYLIIRMHYRYKHCLIGNCRHNILGVYRPKPVNREICNRPSLVLKEFAWLKDGLMLNSRGNDMIPLLPVGIGYALDGQVIGLCPTACKDYLLFLRADE